MEILSKSSHTKSRLKLEKWVTLVPLKVVPPNVHFNVSHFLIYLMIEECDAEDILP